LEEFPVKRSEHCRPGLEGKNFEQHQKYKKKETSHIFFTASALAMTKITAPSPDPALKAGS
jgi:hypothetical protein